MYLCARNFKYQLILNLLQIINYYNKKLWQLIEHLR